MAPKPTGPVRATDCLLVRLAAAVGTAHLPLVEPTLQAARSRPRGVPPATADDLAHYFAGIGDLAARIDAGELDQTTAHHWHDRWHPLSVALGNLTMNPFTPAFDTVWWALSTVFYENSFDDFDHISVLVSDYCAIKAIRGANLAGVDYSDAARIAGINPAEWTMFVTFVADAGRAAAQDPVGRAIELVRLVTAPRP